MPDMNEEKVTKVRGDIREKDLLNQIASLLVSEALINPDEQIRFLALLKEEN